MVADTPADEKNLDIYGAPPIPWVKVQACLDEGITQAPGSGGPDRHTCWLATVHPDGRPEVRPVGVFLDDGTFYFTSGTRTRKSRNLAEDARCSITVATHPFDIVIEGEATLVTDDTTLQRVARAAAEGGWEATVQDGTLVAEYSAPSAGPPPWHVYEVRSSTVYAFGTAEPYGAARFRF